MFSRFRSGDAPKKDDWAVQAADSVERVIDAVRDKAVLPLTTLARALVYGLLAGILGLSATVLLCIALVRVIDVYADKIPGISDGVWVADLALGGVFVLIGLVLWAKRNPKTA